jgi:hypothetical protein
MEGGHAVGLGGVGVGTLIEEGADRGRVIFLCDIGEIGLGFCRKDARWCG